MMFGEHILCTGHHAKSFWHEWSPQNNCFSQDWLGYNVITNTPKISVVYFSLFLHVPVCLWEPCSTVPSLWYPSSQAANIWNMAFVTEKKKVPEDLALAIKWHTSGASKTNLMTLLTKEWGRTIILYISQVGGMATEILPENSNILTIDTQQLYKGGS